MKKALVISMMAILALSATACGKKAPEAVIIQAQDAGKDTTKSEEVKGDSAGKIDVDSRSGQESKKTEPEITDGWEADIDREIPILGEWDLSNNCKVVLDNGYNLTYIENGTEYHGSYTFNFSEHKLSFIIWDKIEESERDILDDEGNIVGTEKFNINKSYKVNYAVDKYEHNEEYTTGTLYLKDENNTEITGTLTKPIEVDYSVENANDKKARLDREDQQRRREEETGIKGITVEQYQEWLVTREEAIANGEYHLENEDEGTTTVMDSNQD